MLDLSSLSSATDIEATFKSLIGGDVFVHQSPSVGAVTIHHTGGYLEVAGMENATVEHLTELQRSRFDRIDADRPIFIAMRDRGDGAHLCWWAR